MLLHRSFRAHTSPSPLTLPRLWRGSLPLPEGERGFHRRELAMHLLAAQPGAISDGSAAVDLGQTPGDIVVLSAADSEIACLAAAQRALAASGRDVPSLRLASLLKLGHNYSVDVHLDAVLSRARLVVVRLLGGRSYWPYGVERLAALAREKTIALALLPGDDQPDA